MPSSPQTFFVPKAKLRTEMRRKRLTQHLINPCAANSLRDVFLLHVKREPNSVIGGYMPFRGEMDVIPLLATLRDLGHTLALPTVTAPRSPLLFRRWDPHTQLKVNAMGIPEPVATAPEIIPDLLLVPLLAFDRQRNRLGYGGGFYDRTLFQLRQTKHIQAIGVGFAFQRVEQIPTTPHDAPLDLIVTELTIF